MSDRLEDLIALFIQKEQGARGAFDFLFPRRARSSLSNDDGLRVGNSQREAAIELLRQEAAEHPDEGLQRAADGRWSRGFMTVVSRPCEEGAEIFVFTAHREPTDSPRIRVYVSCVWEADHRPIFLEPKAVSSAKVDEYVLLQRLVLDRNKANEQLDKVSRPPGQLQLVEGTTLFVTAGWNGHKWGGLACGEYFQLEAYDRQRLAEMDRMRVLKVVSLPRGPTRLRMGRAQSASIPVDPITLLRHPLFSGKYRSQCEPEAKVRVERSEFHAVYKKLSAMADPKSAPGIALRREIFQEDVDSWSVEPVKKYWTEPPDPTMPTRFATVTPFKDVYLDTSDFDLLERQIAIRVRQVETDKGKGDHWNFKPGPGRRDGGTNIVFRIEESVQFVRDSRFQIDRLKALLGDDREPLNPWVRVHAANPSLTFERLRDRLFDLARRVYLVGHRFKFLFKHRSRGVAFEVSLDAVGAMVLNDQGLPLRAESVSNDSGGNQLAVAAFGQLEIELNHRSFDADGETGSNGRESDGEGAEWLKTLPEDARLAGSNHDPLLMPSDLDRMLKQGDPDIELFRKVAVGLQSVLLGKARPSIQKAALAVRLVGKVKDEDEEGFRETFADELEWSRLYREMIGTDLVDRATRSAAKALKSANAKVERETSESTQRRLRIDGEREAEQHVQGILLKVSPLSCLP